MYQKNNNIIESINFFKGKKLLALCNLLFFFKKAKAITCGDFFHHII